MLRHGLIHTESAFKQKPILLGEVSHHDYMFLTTENGNQLEVAICMVSFSNPSLAGGSN